MTLLFEKHCGKKQKILVTSIFSFSHNVFESPCFRVVKTQDYTVKSLFFSKQQVLTHSHTMTPFDAPGKPAF